MCNPYVPHGQKSYQLVSKNDLILEIFLERFATVMSGSMNPSTLAFNIRTRPTTYHFSVTRHLPKNGGREVLVKKVTTVSKWLLGIYLESSTLEARRSLGVPSLLGKITPGFRVSELKFP